MKKLLSLLFLAAFLVTGAIAQTSLTQTTLSTVVSTSSVTSVRLTAVTGLPQTKLFCILTEKLSGPSL